MPSSPWDAQAQRRRAWFSHLRGQLKGGRLVTAQRPLALSQALETWGWCSLGPHLGYELNFCSLGEGQKAILAPVPLTHVPQNH